jgi:hypothetical protein
VKEYNYEKNVTPITMEKEMSVDDMINYFSTWSIVNNFEKVYELFIDFEKK